MTKANRASQRRTKQTKAPGEYEVGYKKPPKQYQWNKGDSGNKSGRPKKRPTFLDLYNEALERMVPVTVEGRRVKRSRRWVAAEQWANKYAQGTVEGLRVAMEYDQWFKPDIEERKMRFTLRLEDNQAGPSWQILEGGRIIDQG